MFVADYVDGEWKDAQIIPYQNLSISPANIMQSPYLRIESLQKSRR